MLSSHGLRAAAKKNIGPPSVTYITYAEYGTSATSHTFSGVSIGGPGLIAIVVHAESSSGSSVTISSATIGGIAATIVQNAVTGTTIAGIITAEITSGTTANVSITFSSPVLRRAIGVWRIQNYSSPTASVSTNAGTAESASAATNSVTLNSVQKDSVYIAGITIGTEGTRVGWTNLTERYDTDVAASLSAASGGEKTATSTANITVTATFSAAPTQATTMVAAAWL